MFDWTLCLSAIAAGLALISAIINIFSIKWANEDRRALFNPHYKLQLLNFSTIETKGKTEFSLHIKFHIFPKGFSSADQPSLSKVTLDNKIIEVKSSGPQALISGGYSWHYEAKIESTIHLQNIAVIIEYQDVFGKIHLESAFISPLTISKIVPFRPIESKY